MKVTGKQFRLGPYESAEKAKADPMKAFLDEMKAKEWTLSKVKYLQSIFSVIKY